MPHGFHVSKKESIISKVKREKVEIFCSLGDNHNFSNYCKSLSTVVYFLNKNG